MKVFKITLLSMYLYCNASANNIALPCYGCHGPDGKSSNNTIPSIAGLEKQYFIKALKEYQNKKRDNYLMHIISKGYTEEEIESLAIFFNNKKKTND